MEQQQNVQTDEGVSLIEIINLLLTKIKLLIIVVLIGGILGGAFAVWKTIDVNYFGTKVEFYVNPEKPEDSKGTSSGPAAGGSQYGVYGAYGRHVMDNMIKLLSSDSFAERLLLNGEMLPDLSTQWFDEEEVDQNGTPKNVILTAAVNKAKPFLENVAATEDIYNKALTTKAEAVKAYSKTESDLNSKWQALFLANAVSSASFDREEYFTKIENKYPEIDEAYRRFNDAQASVADKTKIALDAEEAWKTAKKEATEGENSPVETALNIWRESDLYAEQLGFFKDSVSYDYLESDDDYEDANNLARSFIYVGISIQHSDTSKGFEIATMILNRVKKVVPLYVAENMTVPEGYSGTNCQRITRTDNVRLTNPRYTTTQAIKYAVLMAAVAFVFACVVIILLDRSDKRLRDTEIITRKFNVPLLGIIPTIEDLKAEQNGKKKANKTKEVK